MNKNKLNIFLIPSAIALWVIVLYRIFSVSSHPSTQQDHKTTTIFSDSIIVSPDTLNLILNYRDPFVPSNNFIVTNHVKMNDIDLFAKPKEITQPQIKYLGQIDLGHKGKEIGLTLINDHSYLLCKGDTIKGLRIQNLFKDSLIIEFNRKMIRINKTQQNNL